MPLCRSRLTPTLRNCFSQAIARSTGQRSRPRLSELALPRCGISPRMPALAKTSNTSCEVYPVSARTTCGFVRGRPLAPATFGNFVNTKGKMKFTSCSFAADTMTAMGVPDESVITFSLLPQRPRSVGFGPTFRPRTELSQAHHRSTPLRGRQRRSHLVLSGVARRFVPIVLDRSTA